MTAVSMAAAMPTNVWPCHGSPRSRGEAPPIHGGQAIKLLRDTHTHMERVLAQGCGETFAGFCNRLREEHGCARDHRDSSRGRRHYGSHRTGM